MLSAFTRKFFKCLLDTGDGEEYVPDYSWLSQAMDVIPNGDINDFWNYVMDSDPELHKGAPYGFFMNNHKIYLRAVFGEFTERESELSQWSPPKSARTFGRNLTPQNDIDANEQCPETVGDYEDWDYADGGSVTIENRRVILKKSVEVTHLIVRDGGVLVFGEPEDNEIEVRAFSVRDLQTKPIDEHSLCYTD